MPKVEVRPGTYRGAHGRALTPGINDFHMVEAREGGGRVCLRLRLIVGPVLHRAWDILPKLSP